MYKPIATRARKPSWEKVTCDLCEEPPHVVVSGIYHCNYCGNEITLCRMHAEKLSNELLALRNEGSDVATADKE